MYTLNIDRRPGGLWQATVSTPRGRRFALARVAESDAVECLEGVGLSFADVARAARRLARSAAVAKALRAAARIARNPALRAVLPPQVSIALRATMAARRLIVRARRGDASARARLASARQSPRAARAIRAAQRAFGEGC
jgi:hypothetical protein